MKWYVDLRVFISANLPTTTNIAPSTFYCFQNNFSVDDVFFIDPAYKTLIGLDECSQ